MAKLEKKVENVQPAVEQIKPALSEKEARTIIISLLHSRNFYKNKIESLERSIFSDITKIDADLATEYQEKLNKAREDHRAIISAFKQVQRALDEYKGNGSE